MLFVCQRLGRKEGSAASDACLGAFGFRLATVEYEVAVREAGSLSRLPTSSSMVISESPAGGSGPITLDSKHAGKPIAGNRHDGFEEAGAGNQLTVSLLRHSQRKRKATARLNLRSVAPVLDPTTRDSGATGRRTTVLPVPLLRTQSAEDHLGAWHADAARLQTQPGLLAHRLLPEPGAPPAGDNRRASTGGSAASGQRRSGSKPPHCESGPDTPGICRIQTSQRRSIFSFHKEQ